jgi:hypothetical protein
MDLALTATHFPKQGLTFAILFGCSFAVEKDIIMRLAHVTLEAAHPLLMPGIFAELERKRHTSLVEELGNKLETLIFELDFHSNDLMGPEGAQAEARSKEKREAYLDLAYLRNSLVSWNTQLAKMVQHCRQLNKEEYSSNSIGNSVLHQNNDLRVGKTAERVASRSSNISRSLSKDKWHEVEASEESGSLIRKESAQLNKEEYSSKSVDNLVLHQNNDLRVGRTIERVASRNSNVSRSSSMDEWHEVVASEESDSLIRKQSAQLEKTTHPTNPQKFNGYVGKLENENIELAHMQTNPHQPTKLNERTGQPMIQLLTMSRNREEMEDRHEKLRDTAFKIESRLMSIRDEYDDKIRDCTMRVDGMAMSTQWVRSHLKLQGRTSINLNSHTARQMLR